MSSKLKKKLLKADGIESIFYGGALYGFVIGAALIIFFQRIEISLHTIINITLKLFAIGTAGYAAYFIKKKYWAAIQKLPLKLKIRFDNKIIINKLINKS